MSSLNKNKGQLNSILPNMQLGFAIKGMKGNPTEEWF